MQIQKPGGHKDGRASFPDQFQYKVSKIHQPNSYSRERNREEERKGERAMGERAALGRGEAVFYFRCEGERRG